jgi:hypothetical protein
MEDHSECMLVLIGATPEGQKELIGFIQYWRMASTTAGVTLHLTRVFVTSRARPKFVFAEDH